MWSNAWASPGLPDSRSQAPIVRTCSMRVLDETSAASVASSGSRYSQGAVTADAPSSHRHQLVDVRPAHDTTAYLEILDHRDEPLRQRHGDAELLFLDTATTE